MHDFQVGKLVIVIVSILKWHDALWRKSVYKTWHERVDNKLEPTPQEISKSNVSRKQFGHPFLCYYTTISNLNEYLRSPHL
jgi:hypothetical protein